MDLYFKRHDGQAVTVVDFRKSMEDANQVDLGLMHQWYIQAGTPVVEITTKYDACLQTYQITCTQKINSRLNAQPLLIPIRFGLLSEAGEQMVLRPDVLTQDKVKGEKIELLLLCTMSSDVFTFTNVTTQPTPSFLRGFSAPIHLEYDYSDAELSLLACSDSDSFVRWESFQTLALNEIKANIQRYEANQPLELSEALKGAFLGVLQNIDEDSSLIALTITLPDLTYIGEQFSVVNVDAIYHVHQWLKGELAQCYGSELLLTYQRLEAAENKVYRYHKEDIGYRKLKNACLRYLILLPNGFELAKLQYDRQHNMTDVLSALEVISHTDHLERTACLHHFYEKWQKDTLVLDKWFALQAASHHRHALEHVKELVKHKNFINTNPNRVRSVLGVFGRLNLLGFHRADGKGYEFLAEQVIKIDAINPQVAARIVAPFTHWQRYDDARGAKMKAALKTILNFSGVSKDVYEIVSKSLG
jgi:aminopeptidase N